MRKIEITKKKDEKKDEKKDNDTFSLSTEEDFTKMLQKIKELLFKEKIL